MRVTRLMKLMAVAFVFFSGASLASGQNAAKTQPTNPDVIKQEKMAQEANTPYENAKQERLERIKNNDLTPEMRAQMEAGKLRAQLEHRLETLIVLRDRAISNGDPTGKYDSAITEIQEDLE